MAKYYDIKDDIQRYPDAIIYVVWSLRGPGKTYSTLRYGIENGLKELYIKRTVEDVNFISGRGDGNGDVSPWAPLNRDFGYDFHINPVRGKNGFATVDSDDGKNIGYVIGMSAVHKVKGFELSDTDIIVYDEFLPQLSEMRINRKEGEILLDLHATVSRDRTARGKPEIPIILLANSTTPVSPVTETLKITDDIVEMSMKGIEERYIPDRHILLRNILTSPSMSKESRFYSAVKNTKWARMAYGNEFAYVDFSKVRKVNIKGSICHAEIRYNGERWFLYQNQKGVYIMSKSASNNPLNVYNFDVDGDRQRLWYDYIRDLQSAISYDEAFFDSYSMYYMVTDYRKLI